MLDLNVWTDDICSAIKSIKGIVAAQDTLLLNAVLFKLMKSPLWDFEFKGASLSVHQDSSGYSFITLPELNDPDNDSYLIRNEVSINPLSHRYEHSEYRDEQEVWEFDKNAAAMTHEKLVNVPFLDGVIELLSQQDKYQALLTTDPVQIRDLMAKRNDLRFETFKSIDVSGFNTMSGMSTYGGNTAKEVFGHRYANEMGNRIHIVARNFLGPVGIIALFDHSTIRAGRSEQDLLSVSYISVSPGYRRAGIASSLMRWAFEYCQENKKILGRTKPSEIGKLTVDYFSHLAREHAPLLPFLKSHEMEILQPISRQLERMPVINYERKCSYIEKALIAIRAHEDNSGFLNDRQRVALDNFCKSVNIKTLEQEFTP
jgi:GNAT superfamily N-acetyltransferase